MINNWIILILSIWGSVMLFGTLVSCSCSSNIMIGCVTGPLKIAQDVLNKPVYLHTEEDAKRVCKANDDMWNCLTRNRCDMSQYRSSYETTKRICENPNANIDVGCSPETLLNCVKGPMKTVQDWYRNPGYTQSDIRKLCKANNDMGTCLSNNKCDPSLYKSQYETTKQRCSSYLPSSFAFTTMLTKRHHMVTLAAVTVRPTGKPRPTGAPMMSGSCSSSALIRCSRRPMKVARDVMNKPAPLKTLRDAKRFCKATNDMGTCLSNNKCDSPLFHYLVNTLGSRIYSRSGSVHEIMKQTCSNNLPSSFAFTTMLTKRHHMVTLATVTVRPTGKPRPTDMPMSLSESLSISN